MKLPMNSRISQIDHSGAQNGGLWSIVLVNGFKLSHRKTDFTVVGAVRK